MFEDKTESSACVYSVSSFDLDNPEIYGTVKADYDLIRQTLKTKGFASLRGKMGTLVQPRTKGAVGHPSGPPSNHTLGHGCRVPKSGISAPGPRSCQDNLNAGEMRYSELCVISRYCRQRTVGICASIGQDFEGKAPKWLLQITET